MSGDFLDSLGAGISDTFSGLAGGLAAGAGTMPVSNPVTAADTSSASNAIVDPSTVAQADINAGQPAPTATQGQDQQQQNQNPQQQNQNPQSAVAQIQKALKNLAQQKRQNPWLTGGNIQTAAQGQVPPLNLGQPAPQAQQANLPSPAAQEAEMIDLGEGAGRQAEYGWDIPPGSGEGASTQPEYGPGATGPGEVQGPQIPPPAVPSGVPAQAGAGGPPTAPAPQSWWGPFVPNRRFLPGGGPYLTGVQQALQSTPAETGELPPGGYQSPPGTTIAGPASEVLREGEGGPAPTPDQQATTPAPETGKPVETVDPKTKKPVDPKTGEKLPTKKDEPTNDERRPFGEVPTGEGPIMRDMRGGQSVPMMLGQLAQIALPLLMMGMMGGRRRGGRHFRVGGRFGHEGGLGGRNYWPYHHPTYGWRVHGHHPGGEWREMHPRHYEGIIGGGFGGGPLGYTGGPQGGGGPGQGGTGPQPGGVGPQGGAGGGEAWRPSDSQPAGNPNVTGSTASADDVMAMIRQRESGGTNAPPWNNYDYPHSHASGYYQFEPATWRALAQQSGDAEAQGYPEAYLAPQAVQDRIARYALQRYGPNDEFTWKESTRHKGQTPYPNVDPASFASNQPGHTKTGDSKAPNPDGNLAPNPNPEGGDAINPVMPNVTQTQPPTGEYQPSPI